MTHSPDSNITMPVGDDVTLFGERKDDGGAAFPMPASETSQGGHFEQEGMKLRDFLAAKAIGGIGTWMPNGYGNLNSDDAMIARAEWAYRQADAMLKARGY